jgi:hypothetical protein
VLAFIAAWGWLSFVNRTRKLLAVIILGALALLLSAQYSPYYFTYFNPLLGGATTAPGIVRIGWGEGLDELGRWLNGQPEAASKRLGVRYTATIYPFYQGPISSPVSEELDYVAFYIKQSQSGYPAPEILGYFERQGALHTVSIGGIDYAQVYQGPAMRPIDSHGELPIAYRPHTIYAPIGQQFKVDLLWPAGFGSESGSNEVRLALRAIDGSFFMENTAPIVRQAPEVAVSTHTYDLPSTLPRTTLELSVNDVPIDLIKARQMTVTPQFEPLSANLNDQLRLVGTKRQRQDDRLSIDLAWQALRPPRNDYTVFIQLLDQAGLRVAGVDVAPDPGFTTLDRNEVFIAPYTVPLTADLAPGSYNIIIGLYYFAGDELINVGGVMLDEPVVIDKDLPNRR